MSDRRKEAEEKMAKAIFISNDCWLEVFDLLPLSQLGLGIALISHRFDIYVDEHFKTRKWTLKFIEIRRKIGENGTKEMEITNDDGEALPIPQIQMPRKVIGFEGIDIFYIDQNAIAFLRRFRQLFAKCPINLGIYTDRERVLELILHNIWPMIGKNIDGIELSSGSFHHLRQIVPSILNECPLLRIVNLYVVDLFTEFPADDNAMASDRQAVAKWLFTRRPDGVPKVLKCWLDTDHGIFTSRIEDFKAAFASASSPVNFIVIISFLLPFADSVVPFAVTNESTGEQLAFKGINDSHLFLLVRCPIVRDESKWTKWEEEAIGWEFYNKWDKIYIYIDDEDDIGNGLLDTTPGPSDQQQK
ncbi:hypothetical protein niasHT_035900 [Heterodera trifolii]|uniref:F-box domain-containing protein n=1 Tax=Heterodera trifolii TaxID=157864 RepID=A0ABD2IHU2_9BILA